MKIEKLRPNKIKVTFSPEDMLLHGLTAELVAKNSPAVKEIFWDVLRRAEEETGFSAEDGRLMIEAMPAPDDSLVLYITKLDENEVPPVRKKVRLKVKTSEEDSCFIFSSFDDIISMARAFPHLDGGDLYFYKDKYYLVMTESTGIREAEFGSPAPLYAASVACEHGKLICSRALETLRAHFA